MEVTKNPVLWPDAVVNNNNNNNSTARIHITGPQKSGKTGRLDDSFPPVSKEFQESRSSQRPPFRTTLRDLNVHRFTAS